MKYIVTLNGKKYEVEVEKGKATEVCLGPADPVATAPVAQATTAPAPTQAPVAVPAGEGEPVEAPMTGNIIQIKCSAGQAVKKGDVLFILEAMKMENEIAAPKDGTVTSVQAVKGSTVDTGAILCTLA